MQHVLEAMTQHDSWSERSCKKCNLVTKVIDFGLAGMRQTQRQMMETYGPIVGYLVDGFLGGQSYV